MKHLNLRRVLISFFLFSAMLRCANAQILTFDFAGLAGNETAANSNTNNSGLTTSTISRGAGLTAAANADRFNSTGWALTSIANAVAGNNYVEFTITPTSGNQFSVSSIVIQLQRSGTGHTAIALRNSIGGYSSNLDGEKAVTDNTTTQTFTFTFSQANSSSPVTYRLYGYAEAGTGSGGPGDGTGNDIVVNGTVTPTSGTSITTTGSLIPFITTAISTPSSEQSFTVSGTSLTNDISLTAPTGYQISTTSGSGFGSSLTLTQSGGTVSSTTIFTRFNPSALSQQTGGNITATSTGATTQNIAVSGEVTNLGAGDIAFVAFQGVTTDFFRIVALQDIPANTRIWFTDKAWDGNSGILAFTSGEGASVWTSPSTTVAAGTVIEFAATAGTVSIGTGAFTQGLGSAGEQLFAYQGTLTSPTFIAGYTSGTTITSGTPTASGTDTWVPAALTTGTNFVALGGTTFGSSYVTAATHNRSLADMRSHIHTTANLTTTNTSTTSNGSWPTYTFNIIANEPTTQPSFTAATSVGNNNMTLNFSGGNGTSYIVVMREGSAVTATPVDATSYSAVSGTVNFTTAAELTAGQRIVYNGTTATSTVTVNNLSAGTTYHYAIYAYNGTTTTVNYFTTSPGTGNQLTTGSANSNASDIIAHASFTEPSNIAYQSNQENTNLTDVNSVEVARFTLRDGGATTDADVQSTTLNSISFAITNHSVLRRLALYDGTTELGEIAISSATATFSSLTLAALDNATKDFSLRASFAATVTDNTQFGFTVSSATSDVAGSTFAAANAGGAASSTTGDRNRIEVTATALVFVQNTSNGNTNVAMSPSVTVAANDGLSNRDLDFTASVSITSSGTLTGTPVGVSAVSGLATFSTLTHTVAGTGLQLTAASTGLTSATSNTFTIVVPPTTIYSTNFGTSNSTATTLQTGWVRSGAQESNLELSTASVSSTYSTPIAFSGGANLADGANTAATGTATVTLSGQVNTIGYSNIELLYGARGTSAYPGVITLEWSADGTTWNSLLYTDITRNSNWALINGGSWISLPSGAENQTNLRFRFTFVRSGTSGNYRIDDFTLRGILGPISTNADLSALTLSSGTLSPTFAAGTTSYTASVSNATTSITITPTKADINANIEVRVNGGTYASVTSGSASGSLSLNVGSNTIDVRVTAQDGTTQKIYTTTVTRAASSNADLIALTLSSGTLSPAFAAAITSYTSSVTNTTTSITVTPTRAEANSNIEVRVNGGTYASVTSGSASGSLSLNVGSNTIDVRVAAQDGTTQKIYTTTVTRAASSNADLSDLTLSSGTLSPTFAAGTISYTASVSNATTSITVTPTRAEANATIEARVNGGTYASVTSGSASGPLSLNVGSNTIDVRVTAQDASIKTYTVTVTRAASLSNNADLSDLTLSSGALSPTFAAGTISYTASVSNATTSITVTPTRAEANATIEARVNGGTYASVTSGSASGPLSLNVGSNTIDIRVTAQDGTTQKTYTTTVTRAASSNADLSDLALSSGTLSPTFAAGTISYTASVSNATTSITLTPTRAEANATIEARVNGGTYASVTSGSASGSLSLNVGSNTIDVRVTAQDASTKIYTVTVTRAASVSNNADLSDLTLSSGILSPTFAAGTISYTASVSNATTSITLTPTRADANATIEARVNGGTYASVTSGSASGLLSLNIGSNTIDIRVTAQDASAKTYTITLTRFALVENNTISSNQTICSGSTPAALTGLVPTGGNGSTYTFQWLASTSSATTGFSVISGAISQNYSPTSLTQTTWYRRLVNSSTESDTSSAIAITINTNVSGNTIGSGQTICSGTIPNQLLGSTATGGTGVYTYLWQSSTTSASEGFATASGTNSGLNYTPSALTQTTWYRRVVSSGVCAGDTSSVIVVTINTAIANNTVGNAQSICSGATPAILTGSTPTGGNGVTYTYLWQSSTTSASSGFASANGTNNTINYSPGSLTQTTWYRRVVSSGVCSTDTSSAIQITLNPALTASVSLSATSTSVCSTSSITFTATPINGGTSPSYQWKLNGTNVGINSSAYVLASPSVDDSIYVVLTSNATPCLNNATANSNGIKLTNSTVTPTVSISLLPDSLICVGTSVTFTATPTNGGGTPSYQWKLNGTNVGSNSNTYTSSSLVAGDSVTVVLTSNASCLTSSTATSNFIRISLRQATAITGQPINITRCLGSSATFGVTASGNGAISYQWRRNGINISGATSANYTIATTALSDSGSYSVEVTASCGSVASNIGYLTMTAPVTSNTVSSAQTTCSGTAPATLTGSTPTGGNGSTYTYQWLASTGSATTGFSVISGAISQNFSPSSLTQNTWYRRIVSSGVCALDTSSAVMITVNPATVAGTLSSAATVCSGSNGATLTLAGNTGNVVRWESSLDNFATAGTTIANTTTSLTYTNLTATTSYRAVVQSGVCASANTPSVTITVNPATVAGTVSSAATVCSGTNGATLTLAGNTGNVVRWESSLDNFATAGTTIANTTTSLAYSNITATTSYRAVVQSGVCASANTPSITITVNPATVAGTVSSAATVCSGSNGATLTLAGNTGNVVRWESSLDNFATAGTTIANTTTSLTYTNITATTSYRAVVQSGVCASANTPSVTITVNPATVAGTVSSAATVCSGSNGATLTLAGNTGNVVRWESSLDNFATAGTQIVNTTTSLTYTNLTATTSYRAVVQSGACASSNTPSVTITVNPATAAGTVSSAATVCSGANGATLTLAGNTGNVVRWESSLDNFATAGTTIANTTTSLAYSNITATTSYRAVVQSGVCASANTPSVTITVNPATVAGTVSSAATVCSGTNGATLTLAGNTGNVVRWESSLDNFATAGTTIANTTTSLAYSNITATTSYRAVVQSGVCASANTPSVTITVNPATVAGTVSSAATVCSGANGATLTLAGNTGNVVRWESSLDNFATAGTTIANTTTSLAYTNLTATTSYRAVVQSGVCASANTPSVTITVNPATVAGTVSSAVTVCSGTNGATLTLAGNTGNVIRWESSLDNFATAGTTIANTTTSLAYLNITATTSYRAVVQSGVCASANTPSVTITVNPATVAGTVSSAATVCSGSNGATLTLAGNTGNVVRWESSLDNFATAGTTIANTTTSLAYLNITATTSYRAVVQSDVCASANTPSVTITVNPATVAGTVSSAATVCSGSNGATLTLAGNTGNVIRWESSLDNFATAGTTIANTTTSLAYSNITATTSYRAVVQSGVCAAANTPIVTITVNTAIAGNTATGAQTICSGSTPTALTGSTPTGGNGTTYTYTWLASTTSATTGFASASGTNNTANYSPASLTQNTWFRRVVSSGVCANDTTTAVQVTVNIVGSWTGATSNAWGNVSNWSCPLVPITTTNVTIPASVPNMPVVIDAQQANNITLATGATLTLNNAASRLSVFGAFTNNGTFTQTAGELVMAGSTTQTLLGGNYTKVNITNTNGVNLGGNVTITDSLKLNGGIVTLGTNNLTLTGSISQISGANNTRYISTNGTGSLIVQNIGTGQRTGSIVFPVGNGSYTPATLSNAGTADNFTIRLVDSVNLNGTTGARVISNAVAKTWFITEGTAGGSNATVSLQWNTADQLSGFNAAASYVAFYNNGSWQSTTATSATGSNPFTQTRTGLTVFNNTPFGIGSGGALPVELLSFNANKFNQDVKLNWATASELNNDYFEIQRSVDGINFETIDKVDGNGTSSITNYYNYTDKNAFATNQLLYYRLLQVDFDGTSAYSNIVSVNNDNANNVELTVMPNPFIDAVKIAIQSNEGQQGTIVVSDINGKIVFTEKVNLVDGTNYVSLNHELADIKAGVYSVTITTATNTLTTKLVKKQ